MNLYEITQELAAIMAEIEAQEGEITEETAAKLAIANGQLETKAEAYCALITNTKADIEAYKAEIDRLTKRKKAAENLTERLKEAVRNAMTVADMPKLKAGTFALTLRSTQAVEVTDEAAVPDEFCEYTKKVMKSVIRDHLKAGELVPGCQMVENTSLTIR